MGLFSSVLMLTVVRDVLILALYLAALLGGSHTAVGWFISISAPAVPMLAVLLNLFGFYIARRKAPVKDVSIPVPGLDPALEGFTIVQITDLHIGPTIKGGYVGRIVAAVNALKPDLIAVTGDLVDGSVPHLLQDVRPLDGLSARHGAYFVTGNHEYYSGADPWIAEFRKLGLDVLMNEHRVVEHDGARAIVAGVTDYNGGHFGPLHASDPAKAIAGAPEDVPFRLLLAHQPRSAAAASAAGFTLQLSGHTHGGQFFPWNFFVRLQQPLVHGLARLGDLWVYTSRGTGYWGPPLRLGSPSEITRLRLVRAVPEA